MHISLWNDNTLLPSEFSLSQHDRGVWAKLKPLGSGQTFGSAPFYKDSSATLFHQRDVQMSEM